VSDDDPILAPRGESAAAASHPGNRLEDQRYHSYEHNPMPWWLTGIWIAFLTFGAVYLMTNVF